MKKSFLFYSLILGSFVLPLLNSCHKYPEDPFISLRRPWKRLEGTWKFTSYKINGVEHSQDFDSLLSPRHLTDLSLVYSPFYPDEGWYHFIDNNGNEVNRISYHQTYFFSDDKNMSSFRITGDKSPFYTQLWKGTVPNSGSLVTESSWKIEELYGHNLHIQSNGINIYFEKQ